MLHDIRFAFRLLRREAAIRCRSRRRWRRELGMKAVLVRSAAGRFEREAPGLLEAVELICSTQGE